MKTRIQIYGRGDHSHKHGDFETEVNTISTRSGLVGTHRGGELPARPPRWVLGKTGETGSTEFAVVFAGQDSAETGSPIGGVSLEFATVASVSVLWRDGDDHTRTEIEEAFDSAVAVGLQFAIENMFVDDGGKPLNDIYAINYFHTMKSMEVQPELHQHILINNYGHTADGKVAALDVAYFQSRLGALGDLVGREFRTQLSRRLGVEWSLTPHGQFEIKDLSLTTA